MREAILAGSAGDLDPLISPIGCFSIVWLTATANRTAWPDFAFAQDTGVPSGWPRREVLVRPRIYVPDRDL